MNTKTKTQDPRPKTLARLEEDSGPQIDPGEKASRATLLYPPRSGTKHATARQALCPVRTFRSDRESPLGRPSLWEDL
jgi:hypothetical protein